jgi:hypothetical protein
MTTEIATRAASTTDNAPVVVWAELMLTWQNLSASADTHGEWRTAEFFEEMADLAQDVFRVMAENPNPTAMLPLYSH